MRTERGVYVLLLLYGLLLLAPTPWLPLFESTEARYGEIAREMLASGNYLEPTFNGIYHFHKPPLPYWAMAAGMRLFGVNGLGVRFFGVVAALVGLWFLYRTARLLLGNELPARTALLVLASSALFLAVSRIPSTDIYLTASVLAAQYFLFRQIHGERSTGNVLAYALCLALGFLMKGPLVFLFTLLPFLLAKLVDERHRKVFPLRDILLAAGLFLMIALPWYLVVIHRHPELLNYFLKVQTVNRVATNQFGRDKPFWFYIMVFGSTFLPWLLFFLRGAVTPRSLPVAVRPLLLYVLVPFVVFSLAKSKLATYLLPLYGVAAIIAAAQLHQQEERTLRGFALGILALFSLALALAGFFYRPLEPFRWLLGVYGGMGLVLLGWGRTRLLGSSFVPCCAALLLAISTAGYALLPEIQTESKGYARMAAAMDRLDRARDLEVVVYHGFLPSLSFHREKLAIMALGRWREVEFEGDGSYRKYYVETEQELRERLAGLPRIFMVTEPVNAGEFQTTYGYACGEVFSQRRYTAYLCSRR